MVRLFGVDDYIISLYFALSSKLRTWMEVTRGSDTADDGTKFTVHQLWWRLLEPCEVCLSRVYGPERRRHVTRCDKLVGNAFNSASSDSQSTYRTIAWSESSMVCVYVRGASAWTSCIH